MSVSAVNRMMDLIDDGAWIRRSVTRAVTLRIPFDDLDAALRDLPGRVDYLRHVGSVGFFGRRLEVDLRFGPLHQEYSAIVTSLRSDRLEWKGAASRGVVEWMPLRGERSRLTLTLVWEPDSLTGLLLSTILLDRLLIASEVKRFARHVERGRSSSTTTTAVRSTTRGMHRLAR